MYPNAAIFDVGRPETRVPFSPSGCNWLNRYIAPTGRSQPSQRGTRPDVRFKQVVRDHVEQVVHARRRHRRSFGGGTDPRARCAMASDPSAGPAVPDGLPRPFRNPRRHAHGVPGLAWLAALPQYVLHRFDHPFWLAGAHHHSPMRRTGPGTTRASSRQRTHPPKSVWTFGST